MNKDIIQERREEIHREAEIIRSELKQNEEVQKKVKQVSGIRRYFKNLLDMRGDMMTYRDINTMMHENTEIHGSNMWILMLAVFIASIGLNVNSTAVIIGAMLVSPLMSGIMSMGYSLAVRDLSLLAKAATRFGTQVVISLVTSTIYFLISPLSEPTTEMIARTSPTIWDVMIALFGGMAGMIGNTRRVKGNVVPGVAIATALMPPLCTVGYGIARGDFKFIIGAGYLFLINTLFIALSTALIAVLLRIPKMTDITSNGQKRVNAVVTAITVIAIIPSVYIGANTVVNSVIDNNISNYINNEFIFSDSQVVQSDTDKENKVISIAIIGEHISDQTIDTLRAQMANYGLTDYTLRVTQNMIPDLSQTNDAEKITIAVQESKINELNEIIERQQQEIADISLQKDNEYAELQKRYEALQEQAQSIVDFSDTAEKASSIFTELRNVACGYMNMGEGYYAVLTAETTRPIDNYRLDTIRNWFMQETGSDQCEIKIDYIASPVQNDGVTSE